MTKKSKKTSRKPHAVRRVVRRVRVHHPRSEARPAPVAPAPAPKKGEPTMTLAEAQAIVAKIPKAGHGKAMLTKKQVLARKLLAEQAKAIIPASVQAGIVARVNGKAVPVVAAPPQPKAGTPLPKNAYYTSGGEKVHVKRGHFGDTIGRDPVRRIVDAEPDGRLIFAKVEAAVKTPVGKSVSESVSATAHAQAEASKVPYNEMGASRIPAVSVDISDYEAIECFEGDSPTVLRKLSEYTDRHFAERNVRLGINIIGPAPRILAALHTLIVAIKPPNGSKK